MSASGVSIWGRWPAFASRWNVAPGIAAAMIDRGLLERVDGAGRAARHRLTHDGERARAAGATIVDGVLSHSLGHLSPRELTTLHDLLLRARTTDPE
jgi:hypothetical protein